jgi:hypothetical protein
MNNTRSAVTYKILLLISVLVVSCATISPFSPKAYENATSLKVEALAVMDLATEPYPDHSAEVHVLVIKVNQAYEYAKGMPKNEISTKQWEILKDPERHLLGGFLKKWEAESILLQGYIAEKKEQIGAAFDTIIGLESGKIKSKDMP